MGYISSVRGEVSFIRRKDTNEVAAAREEVKAKIEALGGVANFEEDLEGLSLKALEKAKEHSGIGYFLSLDQEGAEGDNSGKTYDIDQDFNDLVKIADEDNVDVVGTLEVDGEDRGDFHRYVFSPGKVEHQKAHVILQWPDGTTEDVTTR